MAFIRNASLALRRFPAFLAKPSSLPEASNKHTIGFTRCFATDSGNLNLTVDNTSGIAVLEMKRKPVNGLSLEFLTELSVTIEKLENDKQVKGLVVTSAQPKIFTAGLDLMEMYNPKPERMREFWRALQSFWMRLYVTPLATAAAINGHSPAGGCLIALSCDHRVMASGNFAIGLNETLLGIVAPFWFMEAIKNVLGQRESERALQLGRLYSSEDALKIGLVDEVVPLSDIVQHAKDEIERYIQVPSHARQLTKLALRKPTVDKLLAKQDEDIENFVGFVTRDSIQKSLGMYLESLKKKN